MTAPLAALIAGAAQKPFRQAAERFAGPPLAPAFGTVGALRDRALAGEAFDLVLVSRAAMQALADAGAVDPGSRLFLGSVGVGVGVRRGTPAPDLSTPDALRASLLAAASIGYADPAKGATAGQHFAKVLRQLGIAEAVAAKATLLPFGVEVIEAAAQGRFEIAISQASEIAAHPGMQLAGGLPAPLQISTDYEIAIGSRVVDPAGAAAFLALLAGPEGSALFMAAGFSAG